MATSIVEHGLVGVIEDRVGLQLEDGFVEDVACALAGANVNVSISLDALGGQLLAASHQNRSGDVVPVRGELSQSGLNYGRIVLAVDDDQVADGGLLQMVEKQWRRVTLRDEATPHREERSCSTVATRRP
jgi:hypothetical protein